jgi:hypothetical protein
MAAPNNQSPARLQRSMLQPKAGGNQDKDVHQGHPEDRRIIQANQGRIHRE